VHSSADLVASAVAVELSWVSLPSPSVRTAGSCLPRLPRQAPDRRRVKGRLAQEVDSHPRSRHLIDHISELVACSVPVLDPLHMVLEGTQIDSAAGAVEGIHHERHQLAAVLLELSSRPLQTHKLGQHKLAFSDLQQPIRGPVREHWLESETLKVARRMLETAHDCSPLAGGNPGVGILPGEQPC